MVIIDLFTAIMCSINYNIKKKCIDTKNGKNIGSFRECASICLFILGSYFETLKKLDRRNTEIRN